MSLSTPQSKALVYDLTMEDVKQARLLECSTDNIDEQIETIAKVSQIIYDAVDKRYHNFKCL